LFNTAYQSSLRDTPFRVVYGRDPPSIRSYEPGDTRVPAVAKTMAEREEFLADVRARLEQAQATQKLFYDRHHRHVSYQVGDWALLRLRQRSASSLPQATGGKLKARFCGPYQVIELINDVAVRLALPAGARIHNVFHVGLLKKFQGEPPAAAPPLPPLRHGAIDPEPARAVRYRIVSGVPQVLVQWQGASAASATWENTAEFRAKYGVPARGRADSWRGGRCHVRAQVYQASPSQGRAPRPGTRRAAGSGGAGPSPGHKSR